MTLISLLKEDILNPKYWKIEPQYTYKSHHSHLNSPIETFNSCGNCDAARCEYCKDIIVPAHLTFTCQCTTYIMMITKALMQTYHETEEKAKQIAVDLALWDGSYIRKTNYRVLDPNEEYLKMYYPDFFEQLVKNN